MSAVILFARLLNELYSTKGEFMKNICIAITMLLYTVHVAAQVQPVVKDKQYYSMKSNSQKKTGRVFLSADVAMMAEGVIIAENTGDKLEFNDAVSALAGVPVSLAGIPFFMRAGNNETKAAAIPGPSLQPIQNGTQYHGLLPGFTVRIQF